MTSLVRVRDLFHVHYGTNLELNALTEVESPDGVNFVSRTARNNGVSARVAPVLGIDAIPAGTISVAGGGSVMESFLQPEPYYSGRDMYYLVAKEDMSDEEKIYYCQCLRENRYRFSYGRQANRTLAEIRVPAPSAMPRWVRPLPVDLNHLREPARPGPVPSVDVSNWRSFGLNEIFEIKRGSRITKAQQRPGKLPFIGAVDGNNGLTAWIDAKPLHQAGVLTVNYNGNGVAEAFYQPEPFWCSDDVNALYPRGFEMSPAIAMFLITIIRQEKYRFSYGRKWSTERMRRSRISLPARKVVGISGDQYVPDWDFMERYINALPYSSALEWQGDATTPD